MMRKQGQAPRGQFLAQSVKARTMHAAAQRRRRGPRGAARAAQLAGGYTRPFGCAHNAKRTHARLHITYMFAKSQWSPYCTTTHVGM